MAPLTVACIDANRDSVNVNCQPVSCGDDVRPVRDL